MPPPGGYLAQQTFRAEAAVLGELGRARLRQLGVAPLEIECSMAEKAFLGR